MRVVRADGILSSGTWLWAAEQRLTGLWGAGPAFHLTSPPLRSHPGCPHPGRQPRWRSLPGA